jgi:hypothetical protein
MYVWSKRLVIGLLVAFVLLESIFFFLTGGAADSQLYSAGHLDFCLDD